MLSNLTITGKSVDFNAAGDGVQLNLMVAATDTEPAYMIGIPFMPDEAAQCGGLLIALSGACKAKASSILVARGLSVVSSNGSAGG